MGEASEISRAVAAVAALHVRRRQAMYGRAVAFGVANTHCSSERERQFGALRLLTLAKLALTRATVSTANAPMLAPGHIANAPAHLLVIYLLAVEVASAA